VSDRQQTDRACSNPNRQSIDAQRVFPVRRISDADLRRCHLLLDAQLGLVHDRLGLSAEVRDGVGVFERGAARGERRGPVVRLTRRRGRHRRGEHVRAQSGQFRGAMASPFPMSTAAGSNMPRLAQRDARVTKGSTTAFAAS